MSDGWFADPLNRHVYRYFDGHRWTEFAVDAVGTIVNDPIPPPPPTTSFPPPPGRLSKLEPPPPPRSRDTGNPPPPKAAVLPETDGIEPSSPPAKERRQSFDAEIEPETDLVTSADAPGRGATTDSTTEPSDSAGLVAVARATGETVDDDETSKGQVVAGCGCLFVIAVVLLGGLGALLDSCGSDSSEDSGPPPSTTQAPELFEKLASEIEDDSDRVDFLGMQGTTLLIETYMDFPIFRDGPDAFSDEITDIAQDVSKSDIRYDVLEIAVRSLLKDGDKTVEMEVVRADWRRATIDEQDWSDVDASEFLLEVSSSATTHDPGFVTGNLIGSQAATTTPRATSTTQPRETSPPASTWCVEEDRSIPINRSCFVHWPLIVESGELRCEDFDVFFVTPDGVKYGVNGNARGRGEFLDVEAIQTDLPTERQEIQSLINFAASIPGCEVGGLGQHVLPSPSQTTILGTMTTVLGTLPIQVPVEGLPPIPDSFLSPGQPDISAEEVITFWEDDLLFNVEYEGLLTSEEVSFESGSYSIVLETFVGEVAANSDGFVRHFATVRPPWIQSLSLTVRPLCFDDAGPVFLTASWSAEALDELLASPGGDLLANATILEIHSDFRNPDTRACLD